MCDGNIELLQDITSCLVQMVRVCHIPYLKKGLRLTVYRLPLETHINVRSPDHSSQSGLQNKKKAATYSPTLHCSTIGAIGLNFSVRNGKRWNPDAITT